MDQQSLHQRLSAYANEFPYSGINRANAAPATFEALRRILGECERASTDASPQRKRLIDHIEEIIADSLSKAAGGSGDEACNCQAIPGTANYPGPWHPRGDQSHYACAQVRN